MKIQTGVYPFTYVREFLPSFRRKPESRILKNSWTPAFIGITTSSDGVLFKPTQLTPRLLSPASVKAYAAAAVMLAGITWLCHNYLARLSGIDQQMVSPRLCRGTPKGLTVRRSSGCVFEKEPTPTP